MSAVSSGSNGVRAPRIRTKIKSARLHNITDQGFKEPVSAFLYGLHGEKSIGLWAPREKIGPPSKYPRYSPFCHIPPFPWVNGILVVKRTGAVEANKSFVPQLLNASFHHHLLHRHHVQVLPIPGRLA